MVGREGGGGMMKVHIFFSASVDIAISGEI